MRQDYCITLRYYLYIEKIIKYCNVTVEAKKKTHQSTIRMAYYVF